MASPLAYSVLHRQDDKRFVVDLVLQSINLSIHNQGVNCHTGSYECWATLNLDDIYTLSRKTGLRSTSDNRVEYVNVAVEDDSMF